MSTPTRKPERSGSSPRMTSGLVALSSAAILAVYSAGYVRTRSASERVTMAAAERRPPPLAVPTVEETVANAAPVSTPDPPVAQAAIATAPDDGVSPPAAFLEAPSKTSPKAGVRTTPAPQSPAVEQPDIAAAVSTPVAPVPASASLPVTQPAVTAPLADVGTVPTAAASMTPAAPGAPRYKDGTFSGWGSCRHGDIEATVVITGGRIVSATITQCLTRYPCTPWLTGLPAQVIRKQSPNVDYVSGASDSTDAFYGAVYDALFKAK